MHYCTVVCTFVQLTNPQCTSDVQGKDFANEFWKKEYIVSAFKLILLFAVVSWSRKDMHIYCWDEQLSMSMFMCMLILCCVRGFKICER